MALLQNSRMRDWRCRYGFMLAANLICAATACAGLGDDAAGVAADAKTLQGGLHIQSLPLFDIHDISTDSGLHVREYLDRNGIVFAVSWDGPVQPDLQRLLQASFAEYNQARAALTQPGLRRSLRMVSPDLVVETGGHLRAYSGRAYLPKRVPAGATAADLR
jgi:Protein of unknown function (DUF2844)